MKNKIKAAIDWCLTPYKKYKQQKKLEAKIKELKKRDPFIYK
jgi:hypothetical protein